MQKNIALTILLTIALALFACALYLYRPVSNNLTRVTVLGESHTKVAPDTAVVTFAVVTQSARALNAQQENARKSESVKSALEALSSNSKIEVKTSDYNLQPEQDYYSGRLPKILGYTVRNTVTASINDLSQVGAVIDAATKAGANSVESTAFIIQQDSPAQGEALALATKQAMAKAEAIAQSLNGRIVRVLETNEGGIAPSAPLSDEYKRAAMSNAMSVAKPTVTTPVEAGSLNVRSQVVLTVEIEIKR
ncbi:MAG: SIMPL domain-containing protein [Acidobacteria bacterium]|jgi:uncharacterized protein YggE|nr:SIMPL domain-containing protein [Acidobacteriota bacterium]